MLSCGAIRTVIVGTPDRDWTDYRKKGLGAQFLVVCGVTTRARRRKVICIRWFQLQQVRQGSAPGMEQSGTDDCLDTLQIESASRFAIAENDAKQLLYFVGDFPLDDFRRFFSWADGMASATGRSAQICVLTSTNC
jgi:hypothetical protein